MRYVIGLVMLLVVLVGCQAPDSQAPETEVAVEETAMGDSAPMSELKTFKLTGINYRFLLDGEESPELKVKQGDRVRIEFTSDKGFHDWVVNEFSAATERVSAGGSTYIEFVADRKGTFEYYCSVGSHRANGMMGKLVVE